MLPRWSEAFQGGQAGRLKISRLPKSGKIDVVWLRLEHGLPVAVQIENLAPQFKLIPCVVLSDQPTDEEALAAFAAGARGYCNTHAAPQLLVQIAAVVLQGGLWIGESLMKRLVSATARLQGSVAPATEGETWSRSLTDREKQVARTVASGASNKEIARSLGITERTVKAHVGSIFEKLQVRDRLQLSLKVNGHSLKE
ncbi:MAG: response regulator transcription factor [Polaromonas sp.]|nr:response regulator transcription factor [Polaromonas sp.]